MLNHISQIIKEQRQKRGWSQQKLADLTQLDRTTIGALERNHYQDLGIRKVERVFSVFGMTLSCHSVNLPTLDELIANRDKV